jgi:hypothetical protein
MQAQPDRLANPPSQAIPDYGVSNRFRQSEPDPRSTRFRAAQTERREIRSRNPEAAVVDLAEIDGSQNPGTLRKR